MCVGGLQVLDDTNGWCYVRPEPGHAIINLGDSMVQLTGGVLRSNIESGCPRFSLAFVLKPPYACRMERLEGEGIPRGEGEEEEMGTYEEFHAKKNEGSRYVVAILRPILSIER